MRRVDVRLCALAAVVAGVMAAVLLSSMVGAQLSAAAKSAPALPVARDESVAVAEASLGQRLVKWRARPLQERQDQRARFAAWQQLTATERAQLAVAADKLAALPMDEQTALRAQFEMQDQLYKRGWRLGPALGSDYPRLHALFGYVPVQQRDACLALLRQLGPQARDDLAVLAQRIPPQQRDAFRTELLQVAPANRGAWLQQRRQQ